jgi:hypothetical protein
MITPNIILAKLSPFNNYKKIVVDDQTTSDIIYGLLQNHDRYKNEYDKISEIFVGDNVKETARNIYDFLKKNVKYYIEPTKNQTLRSPSAIVAMQMGADCKSYASFILGVFDSLNRKGIYRVPLAYRFASYKENSKNPQHVFAVLYPNTNREIWVDPVLDKFDLKKQPTFYKDKKLNMALIAMSGVNPQQQPSLAELQATRDKLVGLRDRLLINGTIKPNSSKELEFKVAINQVTRAIQNASITGVDPYASVRKYGNMGGTDPRSDRSMDEVGAYDVRTDMRQQEDIGAIDWNNLFKNIIDTTGKVLTTPKSGGSNTPPAGYWNYNDNQPTPPPATSNSGLNIGTLALVGGAGLLVYFLVKK